MIPPLRGELAAQRGEPSEAKLCHYIYEMYDALCGIESTYVFLDSLTAGIEPQHTNTIEALQEIRRVLALVRERP